MAISESTPLGLSGTSKITDHPNAIFVGATDTSGLPKNPVGTAGGQTPASGTLVNNSPPPSPPVTINTNYPNETSGLPRNPVGTAGGQTPAGGTMPPTVTNSPPPPPPPPANTFDYSPYYDTNRQIVPFDKFNFDGYVKATGLENQGFLGGGSYRADGQIPNPSREQSIYAHYLGVHPDNPNVKLPNYTPPNVDRNMLVNDPGYWAQADRAQEIKPFTGADGNIRADLLGGQYTDPATIPVNVLAERLDARNKGFKGQFGTGAANNYSQDQGAKHYDEYGRQTIKGTMADQYADPSLPAGAVVNPNMIEANGNEMLNAADYALDPNGAKANQTLANATEAKAADKTAAGQYDATQIELTDDATVKGQLQTLLGEFENGNTPAWAAPIMRRAEQVMAARGLGASSMAAESIIQAAMEATLPIAQADAATRKEVLFSNAAATNAAKQFNAQSKQQNDQFFANLETTVSTFNADQKNAIEKFNAGEANAISKFNAQMQDAREKFNVQNAIAIDQSNAVWRREINTANTAATNAANQLNATNLLGISNTAMNNLWQEWRDDADFAFTSSENDKTRAFNLAIATMQQDAQFKLLKESEKSVLGAAVGSVLAEVVKGAYSA
jgi:hypothetical protein